jgi:PAS domain S-box-containing protein
MIMNATSAHKALEKRIQQLERNEFICRQDKKALQESLDQYRIIVNDLPLLICNFLPGGKISFVNQAFCEYFGKTAEELVGSNFLLLISDGDRQTIMDTLSALTVESPAQSHEQVVITANGSIRYHRWISRAIFAEPGDVSQYQVVGEDISERRRAEERLRESEALHRITLSNISDAVFITDDSGYFTYICPNVSVIFGYSHEEVVAFGNIEKIIDPRLVSREELISLNELKNLECIIQDKSGAAHILLINVKRVSIKDGTRLYTCRDITERKHAELKLQQQKDFLNTLLETIPNPVFYKDASGRYTGCNKAFEDYTGKSRTDVIGKTVYDLGPDAIAEKYHAMDLALFAQPGKQHYEWHVKGADQMLRDVIFDKATITDPAGKVIGLVGVISDITERKQSEQALRERESTLKAILSASPIGICFIRNRILEWTNHAMYRLWGYERDSLLGRSTRVLYQDMHEYERIGREFYPAIEKNGIGRMETQWYTKKGEKVHCYLQGCQLDPSDSAKGFIVAAMDTTELKRTEDLVRDLSHRLLEAQENEKKMISYELHDCIAQNLSYLKINCDTFFNDHSGVDKDLIAKMGKQSKLIGQTIDSVRELSYGLHPPSLEQTGLTQAISQLCNEFSDFTGIRVAFAPTDTEDLKQDPLLGINIYRLIQEGFNNIRKHADADHVKIVLVASPPNIILRIQDDGIGFNVTAREAGLDHTRRLGVRSMTDRVNLLRGTIKIVSCPGQGTEIFIKIPFSKGK